MKRLVVGVTLILWAIVGNAQDLSYKQKLNEDYATGIFRSNNGYLLDATGDNIANSYRTVFQYLIGKIPGLTIIDNGYNLPFIRYRNGYPALFVNEIRVDARAIASINMSDVAIIKVFRPPFVAAMGGGANGAIAVYTRDGSEEEEAEVGR